ncbi:hypothetical protein KKA39_00045 [Patescibacteria group bacterium]|nr:hypothetical protein [Patescibacteria group bacterium]MBU1727703.1 hypothetical protein [Patescibacteria group bacterium]
MEKSALEIQRQIIFNKTSPYEELSGYIENAKNLIDYAKRKKFDPYNKEEDLIWIEDFKFTRQRIDWLVCFMERQRKDSVDLFLKEKESLKKDQRAKFAKRNMVLKTQITQTHLLINKMMEVESKIDPADEVH